MLNKICLENLPDEILIEICLYLNTFDILYSFGRLNWRLQCTIAEFRSQLNLSFFSLNQFQRFYSPNFLNYVCSRLTKLTLNNECAPGQIQLFEKTIGDECLQQKLPFLKSLSLIEFTNENVTILSKILYIEELNIEFNSYEKLTNKVENLVIYYIFVTANNFRKVSLYIEQGIRLKHQIECNRQLEDLSIQVATFNDLLILFTIAPTIIRLEADIVKNGPAMSISPDIMPKLLTELYLHTKDKQIMTFETMLKPFISNIPSIEYLSFGLRTDDPDYAEAILWADLIASMPRLKTFILGLEIDITTDLVVRFEVDTMDELKLAVFNTFEKNLDSFSVSIYTNTHTLFIDSVPYRFNRDQSYNTSPGAVHALNTDAIAAKQPSHRIVGLSLVGQHMPKPSNDYFKMIRRFPSIKWLHLDSININDENKEEESVSFKLKYLKSLFYMRSTLCKINRTLFDRVFYGHERLDTLKIMYGDLVYLLRSTIPLINGNHIKYLVLMCSGADGTIRLAHSHYFISTFPLLEHLGIELSSSKRINKNQVEIINELITSFKQLRSFRIINQRGTLELTHSLIEDDQIRFKWLKHINAIGSHLILQPKCLALWKIDSQTTYF